MYPSAFVQSTFSINTPPRGAQTFDSQIKRLLLNRALWRNPLFLDQLNFIDELYIFVLGQHLAEMLFVLACREQFSGDAVGLICEFADEAVELYVRDIQWRLSGLNMLVDHLHELPAFEEVQLAAVLVHALEIGFLLRSGFIVAAFQSPDVEPMCRAGFVHAEKVETHWNPLVDIFLDDPRWNDTCFHDAFDAILTGTKMKGLFLQHGDHRLRKWREARITQHGELVLTVTIDEIGISKKVEPVVDVLIERTEEAFLIESAALQHLLRFDAPAVAEVIHQQVAHLPAMAHFFRDNAAQRVPVVFAGRILKKPALLLDRGEFRVPLIDDEVKQGIAHSLVGNLDEFFPFGTALVSPELNFVGTRWPKFCFELVTRDFRIGHTDILLPDTEQIHPVVKSRQTCRDRKSWSSLDSFRTTLLFPIRLPART